MLAQNAIVHKRLQKKPQNADLHLHESEECTPNSPTENQGSTVFSLVLRGNCRESEVPSHGLRTLAFMSIVLVFLVICVWC